MGGAHAIHGVAVEVACPCSPRRETERGHLVEETTRSASGRTGSLHVDGEGGEGADVQATNIIIYGAVIEGTTNHVV